MRKARSTKHGVKSTGPEEHFMTSRFMLRALISKKITAFLSLVFLTAIDLFSQFRFPRPEFENGHVQPPTTTPLPRSLLFEYLDVSILFIALGLAAYFAIKKRSRKGILWLSVFSVLYFGFFREGCVCSVGAIQNIASALFNPAYVISILTVVFFLLPILFTLLFGRVFCAGVCPLGAIQDLFVIKAIKLPAPLTKVLGIIPYLYLGFAILFAATGSDFIICRFDPFVGIFRLDADFIMYVLGAVFLITGIFVARPYCRFFCPYGVILNWVSKFSIWHLSITPSECVQCRLCENSCPFDAILTNTENDTPIDKDKGIKKMKILFLILPLFVILGGWTASRLHDTFAKVHPQVMLANNVLKEKNLDQSQYSLEVETFLSSGKTEEELMSETSIIIKKYLVGSWFLGAFFGLAFGIGLISLSKKRNRTDYVPDKGNCLSCGRCFSYCPIEHTETKDYS